MTVMNDPVSHIYLNCPKAQEGDTFGPWRLPPPSGKRPPDGYDYTNIPHKSTKRNRQNRKRK